MTRPAPVVYAGGNSEAETRSGLQFCGPLLREADYDIRTVQELLGHRDVKTTMIYTHVLNREGRGMQVLRIGY